MKKTYQKPGIYVENFGLSQSIAATCGAANPDSTLGRPALADKNTCGWAIEGGVSVWTQSSNCTVLVSSDAGFKVNEHFVCYNNPNSGLNIFGWS